MSDITAQMIIDKADEFSAIARKVNASSKKRKSHALAAQKLAKKSVSVARELRGKMRMVAKGNISQRNQDSMVLNYCTVIRENARAQETLIAKLREQASADQTRVSEIETARRELVAAVNEAIPLLEKIIENDNMILLMDAILLEKKSLQMDSLGRLGKLIERSLRDSQKAIDGSAKNLLRGIDLARNMRRIKTHLRRNDAGGIRKLELEARQGWRTACDVNLSSLAQAAFADSVQQFTNALAHDGREVESLVMRKHACFEANLQEITVLTVILSMKMKAYLEIAAKADLLKNATGAAAELRAYIQCACRDIAYITALNYDMTGIIGKNNEIENSTIAATRKETAYFDGIVAGIAAMTEVTRYPVEGSARNINNGKLMENALRQVLA